MKIIGTKITISEDDKNLARVKARYGETHHIFAKIGVRVDLSKLPPNHSICWGDGEMYHFLLVKK